MMTIFYVIAYVAVGGFITATLERLHRTRARELRYRRYPTATTLGRVAEIVTWPFTVMVYGLVVPGEFFPALGEQARRVSREARTITLKRMYRRVRYGPVCAIEYEWNVSVDFATCDRCRCSEQERDACAANI